MIPIIGKRTIALSNQQTQMLMDFEVFSLAKGLKLHLWCKPCRRARANYEILGSANEDFSEWRADCECTDRVYRGADQHIPLNPPVVHAREPLEDGSPRREAWTRDDMLSVKAFEHMLNALHLQYAWRCFRCELSGNMQNGVYGVGESNDGKWVAVCPCTRRIYDGADAVKAH